ncbi:MAG: DUF493 family protein [Bacteroidales bacterium]
MQKSNNNSCATFGDKKIKFPTSYIIKLIVDSKTPENISRSEFEKIATKLKVPYGGWTKKESSKGTYTSYSSKITLRDEKTMKQLYADLKSMTNLKLAI